jgi:hypothetical protein
MPPIMLRSISGSMISGQIVASAYGGQSSNSWWIPVRQLVDGIARWNGVSSTSSARLRRAFRPVKWLLRGWASRSWTRPCRPPCTRTTLRFADGPRTQVAVWAALSGSSKAVQRRPRLFLDFDHPAPGSTTSKASALVIGGGSGTLQIDSMGVRQSVPPANRQPMAGRARGCCCRRGFRWETHGVQRPRRICRRIFARRMAGKSCRAHRAG